MLVYTHPKGTIFLSYKQDRSAQGEILGRMKPLFNRSLNYSFSSFNYAGAILYGRIEIGRVSGMMSMPKSISLSGGTLGRSSAKTSGNSFTIETF